MLQQAAVQKKYFLPEARMVDSDRYLAGYLRYPAGYPAAYFTPPIPS